MSKLNIFKRDWLDLVFENRNKKYGAYQLRSENPKTTSLALFIGTALLAAAISSPLIIKGLNGTLGEHVVRERPLSDPVVWDFVPPIPPAREIVEPKSVEQPVVKATDAAPASAVASKRHKAYKVTDNTAAITEEPTSAVDLLEGNPGAVTRDGTPGGSVVLLGNSGEGTGSAGNGTAIVDEGNSNEVYSFVQLKAEPVGGFTSFNKMFVSRFRTPDVHANVVKLQVIVRFIVEKDGSLSDISILRDPGYGAGKEAVRVLKTMPNWKAAVQNNRKVRSQFTLPITVEVR
ncbi:energy transducer TonB [Flavobacterium sp. JP2137]|uniref:energy transducer TonB n=1 Tax=Flavobacterium sp. JP2137 TaxID=3414510 RepID=UPI003D2FB905